MSVNAGHSSVAFRNLLSPNEFESLWQKKSTSFEKEKLRIQVLPDGTIKISEFTQTLFQQMKLNCCCFAETVTFNESIIISSLLPTFVHGVTLLEVSRIQELIVSNRLLPNIKSAVETVGPINLAKNQVMTLIEVMRGIISDQIHEERKPKLQPNLLLVGLEEEQKSSVRQKSDEEFFEPRLTTIHWADEPILDTEGAVTVRQLNNFAPTPKPRYSLSDSNEEKIVPWDETI